MGRLIALFVTALLAAPAAAGELAGEVPAAVRAWYRNPDGSCVQCSIGMSGIQMANPNAATLLWDTEYGPKQRGGSGPDRVARYAKSRGLALFNVTGAPTFDWMKWAARNGRWCAIGAASNHFQTLTDYDPAAGRWFVCNNNSTGKIDEYSEDGFRQLHLASGRWCVILDGPACAAPPRYIKWW